MPTHRRPPIAGLRLVVLLAAAVAAAMLAGCNTVEGLGKDLQAASESIDELLYGE